MLRNNAFNLMNQLMQESKSLHRIKTVYMQDAVGSDDVMAFWKKLEKDKEAHITELLALTKKYDK